MPRAGASLDTHNESKEKKTPQRLIGERPDLSIFESILDIGVSMNGYARDAKFTPLASVTHC
jgi:hypothetical protein